MFGQITDVRVAKVGYYVEACLCDAGMVGSGYSFGLCISTNEMDKLIESVGIGQVKSLLGRGIYLEDNGVNLPNVYTLLEVQGKCWSQSKKDLIGEVCEVSRVEHIYTLVLQHDAEDDSDWVRCTLNAEQLGCLENKFDGKDHRALIGMKAFYFAKEDKAYIALQIK